MNRGMAAALLVGGAVVGCILLANAEQQAALAGPLRNARLRYRRLGERNQPYPPWVQELRGQSGVYVIRVLRDDGTAEVVYVGESHTGRLYETLTRHFQQWRRWKGFWRGQYAEGHDPGVTYPRETVEAAVRVVSPEEALELERRLIRRYSPKDNIVGQDANENTEEQAPF